MKRNGRRVMAWLLGMLPSMAIAQVPDLPSTVASQTPALRWYERLDLEVSHSTLRSRGHSEFFQLFDQALNPLAGRLDPRGVRGSVYAVVTPHWSLRSSVAQMDRAVASTSRNQAPGDVVGQATAWNVWSWEVLGAEWQAYQRPIGSHASGRGVRVLLGAGVGITGYRLRQVGRFVDAARQLTFADDFRSAGRGATGLVSIASEVRVARGAGLRLEWRGQRGSAPMNGDFADFNRLDVSGHQWSAGLVLRPFSRRRHAR